jgi:hypothetical protein
MNSMNSTSVIFFFSNWSLFFHLLISAGPVKGNPILIIAAVVAVLVVAGGKDILY